jgi:putative SOS response-associated peptidase YedK
VVHCVPTVSPLRDSLTTDPNREVGELHPKAMPVILTTPEEVDLWLTAPLMIVARGSKQDGVGM